LQPGQLPPALPPAPTAPWGWYSGPYLVGWAMQLEYCLRISAEQLRDVPIPRPQIVNPLEELPLLVAQGWRDSQALQKP
jgi:hypothetical protein